MKPTGFSLLRLAALVLVCFGVPATGQSQPVWPEGFTLVSIPSSVDTTVQNAWFYKSRTPGQKPLVVSLHTWSGDYNQEDPLAEEILWRDWNYLHPDFRGPSVRPEAAGSDLVIADLADAIRWALAASGADPDQVYLTGVSGGGYTALMAYMKLPLKLRAVHAWAPVTDLAAWYPECLGRNLHYARDLENVTSRGTGFDPAEAARRSPVCLVPDRSLRKDTEVILYTGIHDGYTGSVPISHAIRQYNQLVRSFYPDKPQALIPDSTLLNLVLRRTNPAADPARQIGGRKIHLETGTGNFKFFLFEGGHEMLTGPALTLLTSGMKNPPKSRIILTLGDSNGAGDTGWPAQLQKVLPFSEILNFSTPGKTIGFDNQNQSALNSLKTIGAVLEEVKTKLPPGRQPDAICILLGTNDTKSIFADRQAEIPENLTRLIRELKAAFPGPVLPELVLMSPPPADETRADPLKYKGSANRIRLLAPVFKGVAVREKVKFVNLVSLFTAEAGRITTDGIHLSREAAFRTAQACAEVLTSPQTR